MSKKADHDKQGKLTTYYSSKFISRHSLTLISVYTGKYERVFPALCVGRVFWRSSWKWDKPNVLDVISAIILLISLSWNSQPVS